MADFLCWTDKGEVMTNVRRRLREAACVIRSTVGGQAIWCCLLAMSLSAIMLITSQSIKTVYVRDGSTTELKYTFRCDPRDILSDMGFRIMAYDAVDFSGFSGKIGVISIDRAFPVTLVADGRLMATMTTDSTVEEFLKSQNIELGEFDEINIPTNQYLEPNDKIVIKRVQVTTTVVYETIPHEVEYKENCLLRNGRTRTLIYGQDGERAITYIDRVVDGVLHAREKSESVMTKYPVTQLVLRGTDDPVSDLDFGVALDANGVPVSYKKVLTNQICTGYSSPLRKVKGASRMRLYDGYVAVRADEIPYGTKMYITSPDNKFVYGFAIAADTGIGLMQNIIDIDLFYETYEESRLNGRKYLNVYILE